MNFIITSINNNIAYKYDEDKKQFITGSKEKLLNDLIDNRMYGNIKNNKFYLLFLIFSLEII